MVCVTWHIVVAVVVACGCGRIGFENRSDGAGGDAPTARCVGAELCDGFENGFDTSLWAVGGATIDTTVAHRGSASARFHTAPLTSGQLSYVVIAQERTLALSDPTFYVRIWYLLGASPEIGNQFELIATDQITGILGDFLFVRGDGISLFSGFANRQSDGVIPSPVGAWTCALWTLVRADTATGSISVSGDVSALALPNVQTDATAPIGKMEFGLGFATQHVTVSQPALDLWIDDVIVDKLPITCAD
jgi:hypothetical protein